MNHNHYSRLIAMTALSFVSMYVLMYAMVHTTNDVYNNLNQFYMAGLMSVPMVVIELSLMSGMYQNKRLNALLIAASVMVGLALLAFIRQQTAIADAQFLRSMIPHHSGAILMCERASIADSRVQELCRTIIAGQQAEIDQMRALLRELQGAR